MDQLAIASLSIAVVALLVARNLRKQLRELRVEVEQLHELLLDEAPDAAR